MPEMYLIFTEDGHRVGKSIGFERTEKIIESIERRGKHVKELFFDDYESGIKETFPESHPRTALADARHLATITDPDCTHDGLFYTSTLPINGKQYCGRCGRNVPQYDL